jgi:2-iminobutanoate/2-iminopropanoate deaminase
MKTVRIFIITLCLCLLVSFSVNAQESPKQDNQIEYLKTPRPMALPFSDAVRVGNMLYLSGEIGVDYKTMKIVPGGIKAETKQVMENIKATLEKYGSSMDNVVKCTAMIQDMKLWPQVNEVYVTYFKKDRLPARSAFGSTALALGAAMELECIATVNK